MLPYYLLILFPFYIECIRVSLHSGYNNVVKTKNSNISIVVFFVFWGVMLACRSISCGIDLHNYKNFFYHIMDLQLSEVLVYYPTEQLYFVLNWIVANIYPDFRFFLVITSFLCVGVTGWFYQRESEFALLTILLFVTNVCFVMFYSGLRQSLAMLFVVPAYYMTKQKRLVSFLLIVILAKFFHNSAIIMLLLYPVFHMPLRSKHFNLVVSVIVLFFVFRAQLFSAIIPFFNEKYARHVVSETGAYAVWIMFLLYLLYSFLVLDDSKMNKESLGLRNILFLMTLIQCFASVHSLAMRMNYYFIMLFPIIIPKLIGYPKSNNENLVQESKWGMVLFFICYFFIH
uniref:EpsG family protein n=1 Tax=uncultured Fibrobacter sp. TaxID=261512 RepID=UPI0025DFEFFA